MSMPTSPLDPASILGPGGAVARRLSGYEPRDPQIEMAQAVAAAIEKGEHLLVEAGTGVGKSFAYLVPAIMAAAELGKKIVISTHTIALQEQLLEKDIPFLRSVMPHEFSAVLVKGRSNYVSLRRLDVAAQRAGSLFRFPDEFDQLAELRHWAGKTEDGTRSDLDFRPLGAVWDAVESDSGNCLGRDCPRHKDCFYFKARRRVFTANLLIVNHALFFTDLALRSVGAGILPEYDVVVFDEAHTLEAVASDHLGMRVSDAVIGYTLNKLQNERTNKGPIVFHKLDEAIEPLHRVRAASRAFFDEVRRWRERHASSNGRVRNPPELTNPLSPSLRDLHAVLVRGMARIEKPEERIEISAIADRCKVLADEVQGWVEQWQGSLVYWVESEEDEKRKLTLASAPLNLGPILQQALFQAGPTCILTSATLAVGSPPHFDFLRRNLGLSTGATLSVGSPFDYANQVTLHIARGLPDPSTESDRYEREAIRAIPYYLEKTGGRAFVLFTSYRMMQQAQRELLPWFAERGIRLFAQGDGLPRSKMVEAFKADVDSVLFGTDTFWQGVDVPGEALSNVIIVRLPFSVPDRPLLEARLDEIRLRGGNPFLEFQVPETAIKLKQGFGRLVRSRTDRGIVVILDPRVVTKPYGRTLLGSLPACPRVFDALLSRPAGPPR